MKKNKFISTALSLASVIAFAGCSCGGDKTVESLSIESGLDYTYMLGSDYSFDDVKVKVTWNDGSVTYVGKSDLTIGDFSTETAGKHKVTFSYKGKQVQVELKVTADADEVYEVHLFDEPTTLSDRTAKLAVDSNTSGGFADKSDTTYVVGDDNNFYFNPVIKYLDPETQTQKSFDKYTSVSTVYLKNGNDFVELKDTNTDETLKVSTYVTIDEENSAYDFKDAAINKTFKLVVSPKNFPVGPQGQQWKEELVFRVVDGYNVHREAELGVMTNFDNHNEGPNPVDNVAKMRKFLEDQKVIEKDAQIPDVNGIVLHSNLKLEMDDFPIEYFVKDTQNVYWLQDYVDLYCHKVAQGEEFNFYGNYFAIDATALPKVAVGEVTGNDGYGHSQLFRITSDQMNYSLNDDQKAKSFIRNVEFIGNDQNVSYDDEDNLSPDEIKKLESEGLRGLIFYKAQYHEVTFDNVLTRAFMINGMAERAGTILNLNNYKSYDAYQNQLFIWSDKPSAQANTVAGATVNITNSILEKAGGPAIMSQHDFDDDEDEVNVYPVVNIDSNSKIDSEVFGGEAWFSAILFAGENFPTIITLMEALQNATNGIVPNSFNFLKEVDNVKYINLHTITMNSGDSSEGYVEGLGGKINFKYMDASNVEQTFKASLGDTYTTYAAFAAAPLITSSNEGLLMYGGEDVGLATITQTGPNNTQVAVGDELANKFTNCEYINIFFSGLMITLKTF